jgi:hypothetical protein
MLEQKVSIYVCLLTNKDKHLVSLLTINLESLYHSKCQVSLKITRSISLYKSGIPSPNSQSLTDWAQTHDNSFPLIFLKFREQIKLLFIFLFKYTSQ